MTGLTTVGTIGTGTWQGTAVADTYVADDLTISGGTINNTPIGQTTAAAGDFTAVNVEGAAVVNELRGTGNVFEVYDSNAGSALTVNADGNVYVEDLNINSSFSLTGNMQAGFFTTTAGDPVLDNQLARKAYVDAQVAAVTGSARGFDYVATVSGINNSGGGNLFYYINGANVFYQDNAAGDGNNGSNGYTFTVYGSNLETTTPATLYLRGATADLLTLHNWSAALNGNSATFTMTYDQLSTLAGGQTDGVVRCHLALDGQNSGITFKFQMDSTSAAPTSASFN